MQRVHYIQHIRNNLRWAQMVMKKSEDEISGQHNILERAVIPRIHVNSLWNLRYRERGYRESALLGGSASWVIRKSTYLTSLLLIQLCMTNSTDRPRCPYLPNPARGVTALSR